MSDLISRQAAIDALHMHLMYRMGTDNNKKRLDEWINNLPSAQPIQTASNYLQSLPTSPLLVGKMPSAQPEPQWIPCNERLPEESGRYLISVLDGVGRRTTVAPYQPRYKAWTMTGRMAYWKVIAWMPLPEPYRGEEK